MTEEGRVLFQNVCNFLQEYIHTFKAAFSLGKFFRCSSKCIKFLLKEKRHTGKISVIVTLKVVKWEIMKMEMAAIMFL